VSGRLAPVVAAARPVAADSTDPTQLALLVLWSQAPGRHPDALRRRIRDAVEDPQRRLDEQGPDGDADPDASPAARLVATAGPVDPAGRDDAVAQLRAWEQLGVRVALVGDPAYPTRLAAGWPHTDGPTWLAWRGAPPTSGPAVALVGSRRATGYGTGVAAWLADAAAAAGVRVVSGGAIGVDAAAHAAALGRPGGTSVVLGCGHDVAYPRPHAHDGGLFDRVLAAGGTILSECLPGEAPKPHRIRARNRIVAGLATVVVIVEGRERSGALLTASAALTRDRTVLAVPGDVRAPGSAAPHRLLSEGAAPCTGPADLLAALAAEDGAVADPGPVPTGAQTITVLPTAARRELEQAWPRPVRLEELAARSGEPVGSLLAAVTRARVTGELVEGHDGVRLRTAPAGSP